MAQADTQQTKFEAQELSTNNTILMEISSNSNAQIFLVKNHETGLILAMKSICLRNNELIRRFYSRYDIDADRDKKIMQKISHPFILKLVGWNRDERQQRFNVFTEFHMTDLHTYSNKFKRGRFPGPIVKLYAREVIVALGELHRHNIFYRDLKPQNTLLSRFGHIVLADFGVAKDLPEGFTSTGTFTGSSHFMAPEVLMQWQYTKAIDWWSFGIFLYCLFFGQPPFPPAVTSHDQICNHAVREQMTIPAAQHEKVTWKKLQLESEEEFTKLKNLLSGLLERNPDMRLKEEQIKAHPFFEGVNWDKVVEEAANPPEGWQVVPPVEELVQRQLEEQQQLAQ